MEACKSFVLYSLSIKANTNVERYKPASTIIPITAKTFFTFFKIEPPESIVFAFDYNISGERRKALLIRRKHPAKHSAKGTHNKYSKEMTGITIESFV